MTKPIFVINFKTYDNAFGEQGLALAKNIEEVARIKGMHVIICVPATEIARLAAAIKLTIYAQHTDATGTGQSTGWLPAKLLAAAGASGTLLNHSEHRLENIAEHVKAAKDAGLAVILCAKDELEVKVLRNLPVDYIALEPPELIGGDTAVSTAQPDVIASAVRHAPANLLVGAGIKKRADVVRSLELGAKGVLVASGIVRAQQPKDALLEFLSGW